MSRLRRREEQAFYLFILPWILGFLLLTLGPMLISLYTSFTNWDGITAPRWNNFANYQIMFTMDDQFIHSAIVTGKYVLFAVPTSLIFALLLAALLCRNLPGSAFFQGLYYFPSIVSGVAVFMVWNYMFDPITGVINHLLSILGIQGPLWLASPDWSLPALVLMNLFFCGGQMLIFVAGIKQIPQEYYEAASIDGASGWVNFRKITVPMLIPMIIYNLITSIISTVQVFAQSFIMTGGGPAKSTYFMVYYLYETAFKFTDFGYASAMAWVIMVIILLFSLLVLKRNRDNS